jgi:hypothetical protein
MEPRRLSTRNGLDSRNALAIPEPYEEYSLNEFTDAQISDYLRRSGLHVSVPAWLPSRPLLVAYLAARGLLNEVIATGGGDPAAGWDLLLNNIASRESEIEAGIDGGTVRKILERLATRARSSASGLGPLAPDTLVAAFRDVCGYSPDERGMVLLQRLPGLGVDRVDEGSRAFIDEDFADACRAGDIRTYIQEPFGFDAELLKDVESTAGPIAIALAAHASLRSSHSEGKLNAALNRASGSAPSSFVADLIRVLIECSTVVTNPVHVAGVMIADLELGDCIGDGSKCTFIDSFFGRLEIAPDADPRKLPRFRACYFGEIDGRTSSADLPADMFDRACVFETFTRAAVTVNDVLELEIPLGVRVALTILKKLYQRRGAGRKENALFRGLDHHARRLVPACLEILQREGLAIRCKRGDETIWLPDRSSMRRVGKILAAPTSKSDPAMQAASALA